MAGFPVILSTTYITQLDVPLLGQFPNGPVFLPEVVCYFHHPGQGIELSQERSADHLTCETII